MTEIKRTIERQKNATPVGTGGEALPAWAELESCRGRLHTIFVRGRKRLPWHDAEDVIQDAIVASLEAQAILNRRAWLARAAFHGAISLLRKRGIHAKHKKRVAHYLAQVSSDWAREAEQRETTEFVRAAIDALPEKLRDMVLLTLQGATAEDLADLLQVTVGYVYQLLRRARGLLREYLEPRL